MKRCGIYFCLWKGEVIYIGKTTNFVQRLVEHKCIGLNMDYDKARLIECDESKLDYYEKRWINKFKPRENTVGIRRSKYVKKPKRIKPIRYMKFRKLTLLSRIGFGGYKERTVENMIKHDKIIDLIQMYFNMSHITFFDDILDSLNIKGEWRIEKPGCDREKGYSFLHTFHHERMGQRKENLIKKLYGDSKQYLKQSAMNTAHKSYHQAKNLGR